MRVDAAVIVETAGRAGVLLCAVNTTFIFMDANNLMPVFCAPPQLSYRPQLQQEEIVWFVLVSELFGGICRRAKTVEQSTGMEEV